jgi:hypothetical protein
MGLSRPIKGLPYLLLDRHVVFRYEQLVSLFCCCNRSKLIKYALLTKFLCLKRLNSGLLFRLATINSLREVPHLPPVNAFQSRNKFELSETL